MADLTFNTTAGQTIARELLVCYLHCGDTTGDTPVPIWKPVGKRVEDSSLEIDWSDETKQDILGNAYGTMKKPIITQTFDPCELDAGDDAQLAIWNKAIKDHDVQALCAMDMLIVHFYAGTSSTPFAERYESCMVKPSSLGGEGGGNIGMPIDVTYGGRRTVGTASKDSTTGAITFTATT